MESSQRSWRYMVSLGSKELSQNQTSSGWRDDYSLQFVWAKNDRKQLWALVKSNIVFVPNS